MMMRSDQRIEEIYLLINKLIINLHLLRRDGRVVECGGLENH